MTRRRQQGQGEAVVAAGSWHAADAEKLAEAVGLTMHVPGAFWDKCTESGVLAFGEQGAGAAVRLRGGVCSTIDEQVATALRQLSQPGTLIRLATFDDVPELLAFKMPFAVSELSLHSLLKANPRCQCPTALLRAANQI